jgi:predicted enzyme related to lactoylglutathione lyase
MNLNPVTWFEIPVTDMDRAKAYYEKVFEIQISLQLMDNTRMGWFPFEPNAPGTTGTLIQHAEYKPSYEGTLVYFSVKDIDAVLKRAEDHGGKILNPKFSIGEHGYCGHFEDSEGNRVALHSNS